MNMIDLKEEFITSDLKVVSYSYAPHETQFSSVIYSFSILQRISNVIIFPEVFLALSSYERIPDFTLPFFNHNKTHLSST